MKAWCKEVSNLIVLLLSEEFKTGFVRKAGIGRDSMNKIAMYLWFFQGR